MPLELPFCSRREYFVSNITRGSPLFPPMLYTVKGVPLLLNTVGCNCKMNPKKFYYWNIGH